MKNLKPCPFCGGEATNGVGGHNENFPVSILCVVCKARTICYKGIDFEEKEAKAIKAWNTRSLPASLEGLQEAVENVIDSKFRIKVDNQNIPLTCVNITDFNALAAALEISRREE